MAREMGKKIELPLERINNLILLAHVHELGKIGIPDGILFKSGKLDEEIGQKIATNSADLIHIADLILFHHERWDGKGYPFGLKKNEIPIECRILAIIDAFDAMTNDRPYRKGITVEEAIAEIKDCAGLQFDPELVEIFNSLIKDNCFVQQKYGK